jgi:hypothetical protein
MSGLLRGAAGGARAPGGSARGLGHAEASEAGKLMAVAKRVATECKCGQAIDRYGQALCKACHRKYMKEWRGRHIYVALPKGLKR